MEFVHERFCRWRRKVVACSLVLLVEDNEREVKRGKGRPSSISIKSVVSLSVHVFLGDFFKFLQNSNCAPLSTMFTNDVKKS